MNAILLNRDVTRTLRLAMAFVFVFVVLPYTTMIVYRTIPMAGFGRSTGALPSKRD